jgi:hypothetical protein
MEEASANRPPYDNRDAKERTADARTAHFFFGDDRPNYQTNYSMNFGQRRTDRPRFAANLGLQKSSIQFDRDAGLGPNAKRLAKKDTFPKVADAPPPDVYTRHFDIGYAPLDYTTTTVVGLQGGCEAQRGREAALKAPACAPIADDGDAAGPWKTVYSTDFQKRARVPNAIDEADLRGTHFDPGHDPNDWRRNEMAVAEGLPAREFIDLQASNPVFRGDGGMRWDTTTADMIGVHDKTLDGRGEQVGDARASHLFVGGDDRDFSTTAQDANRMAGTGKPAAPGQDLHKLRGVAFARGGSWDQFAVAKTDVDEKTPEQYAQTVTFDGSYFKRSHFDLEATAANRGRYETTYFEETCRPTLAGDDGVKVVEP